MSLLRVTFFLLTVIMLSNCRNQEVLTSQVIQKRKYRPGFHLNRGGHAVDSRGNILHSSMVRKSLVVESSTDLYNEDLPIENSNRDSVAVDFTSKIRADILLSTILENSKSEIFQENQTQFESDEWQSPVLEEPETDKSSMQYAGIVAIICGILAIIGMMFIPFFGVAFSILTIVFSIKAMTSKVKSSRSLGAAGLVLGVLSLMISLLITLVVSVAGGIFTQ